LFDFSRSPDVSAAELRTQVYIAAKINVIDHETMGALVTDLESISKTLTGLARSIERRLSEH